jgi:hypothetical protein
MEDALDAIRNHNYEKIYEVTSKVANDECGKRIRVTTLRERTLPLPSKIFHAGGCRICRKMGESGCIPAGEAWSGPAEGPARGHRPKQYDHEYL